VRVVKDYLSINTRIKMHFFFKIRWDLSLTKNRDTTTEIPPYLGKQASSKDQKVILPLKETRIENKKLKKLCNVWP